MVVTAPTASAVASGISFGLGDHCNCPLPQLLTPLLLLNTNPNPGTKPGPGSQGWRSHFQHSGWAAQDLLTIRPGLGLFILEPLKQENMQTLHSQGSGYCWVRNDIFVSKIKGTFAALHTHTHTFFSFFQVNLGNVLQSPSEGAMVSIHWRLWQVLQWRPSFTMISSRVSASA